jgi:hypothetical protein
VPLSNDRVISLLNRYFVPVYIANVDYRDGGQAPPEEKAELRRIHQEGHALKLSVGTVHAYVLDPNGRLIDSLHVAEAFKVDRLAAMLEKATQKLATTPGEPLLKPRPQSFAKADPGSLLLHVTARYLERKGGEYVLVEDAGGNWSAFPGEDWVELGPEEWKRLLPSGEPRVGQTWSLDREAAAGLLTRFYPPTENNDLGRNRLEEQALNGTVLSIEKGVVRASLAGALKMKHPFYPKDDDRRVDATLAGLVEFDRDRKRIRSLRLVTDEATYGTAGNALPFGVAVRSVQ